MRVQESELGGCRVRPVQTNGQQARHVLVRPSSKEAQRELGGASTRAVSSSCYCRRRAQLRAAGHTLTHLYLLARVADDTLKKVQPHSVATALASIVLPVPGGPNSITPYTAAGQQSRQRQTRTSSTSSSTQAAHTRWFVRNVPCQLPAARMANANTQKEADSCCCAAPGCSAMLRSTAAAAAAEPTLTGRRMPVKNSGMIMGSTVASSNTRLASFNPAMSVHLQRHTSY